MRLKKLVIHGFKSFADRVEIAFDQGITGIVGPNGSGKSNISDAVRWVLGEQSAKTLRGARMEDVIFSGTEKRKPLAYCEVTLVFDNTEGELPIAFTEVAVTRRVFRSGDSEYLINKSTCRLKDIVELFRDTGIGKEGYSLIGQGRIDEILSVKSEDRRQVFEEAAGIVKYKARKQEAERRIENTRANLARVEDIIQELSDRMEPLREQSETARRYLALRDELKDLELNAFILRSDRFTERIAQLKENVEAYASAIEQAMGRQSELTEGRHAQEALLEELEHAAQAAREAALRLTRDVDAREGAANVLRERIASYERDRERLGQEIASAKDGGGGVKHQIEQGEAELAEEAEKIAADTALLDTESRKLREAEDALAAAEQALEQLKAQVIDAMNRLSDMRSSQSRLGAMQGAISGRIETLNTEAQQLDERKARLTETMAAAQAGLEAEQRARAQITASVEAADARVKALGEAAEQLSRDQAALMQKKHETASRLRVLREMERDYEGYQHAVKQVLMEARRMEDGGVHGVVATILKVPKDYERAIEMVLGGALQNVVVDTEHHAKRMIDHLRANRLGRATFLPLTAVNGRTLSNDERRVLSMPGCIGLASELVSFDKRYQGIVNSLLGRTVIASDLDAGIAIQRAGRHSFRLVTLAGDVMHSGGSMTGGSVQSRMTSLLSREREITEHAQLIEKLDAGLAKNARERENNDTLRAEQKRLRGELFAQAHQQEIALAREEAHMNAAKADMDAHMQRIERVRLEKERLEEQLRDIDEELASLTSEQGSHEQSSADRQQEIQARQRALVALRGELDLSREAVTGRRVRLAAMERDHSAHAADIDRLKRRGSELGTLVAQNEAQLREIAAQQAQDSAQLNEDDAVLTAQRAALAEGDAQYRRLEARRTAAQTALREQAEQLDALRAELDDVSGRHHRAELLLSRTEAELKQWQDRIWEDYELSYEGAKAFQRDGFQLAEAEKRIGGIRSEIREMGTVNVGALDEYRQTQSRFEELTSQREDLLRAEADLGGIIAELMKKMEAQFKTQFAALNVNFQRTFVKLFGGGQAELRLEDTSDVLNCGIEIVAQPPGKKLQLLSLLSGGERALTAIAILFAMLTLKPTPFCMLDEIEAALDDANIGNFAGFLSEYARSTQFVVVTHRKGTMERCDALYGVAMEEKGVSKMVSVHMAEQLETG